SKFTKHYLELSFLCLNIVRKCLRKYEQSTLRPYAFIGATGIAVRTPVIGFMLGHGGRDIPKARIEQIIMEAGEVMKRGITVESRYADLKEELL
ncbi:MAG: hypothetical protein U9Q37_09585, partial [Euryarchaeota archaeon]|nr:hypothetical protein [Euryarchaeota archaeon]